MKTLQTLTTFLLLFISLSTTGQEKQSDATWKETVDFLNKYKNHITSGEYSDCITKRVIEWPVKNISISQSNLTIKFGSKYNSTEFIKFVVTLNKIDNFSSGRLRTTGDYIEVYSERKCDWNLDGYVSLKSTTIKTNNLNFRITDNEMRSRIYKAFQHLTYLAEEKRLAEHKASGDKF